MRTFLAAVLILGAGMGWIVRRAKTQREAVESIERLGGGVRYDHEYDAGRFFHGQPRGSASLRNLLGPEYFEDVTYVGFLRCKDVDLAMRDVARLDRVQEVSLAWSPATDAALAHLGGMTSVRVVSFPCTKVTGAGLAYLVDLPRLRTISSLIGVPLGDAGYRHLGRLLRLVELDLFGHEDAGAGLPQLKGLKRLRKLNLAGTQIDDSNLDDLLGFAELEEIDLGWTRVTGPGLVKLGSLPSLKKVVLLKSEISQASIDRIRARLPAVEIQTDP